jgi:hypothetical protein
MRICQRFLSLIPILLGLATSGAASDDSAAHPGEPTRRNHIEIELDRPAPNQRIDQSLPFVTVSGRAGTLPVVESDVVLLLDQSTMGLVASGIDVDGDGVVGRTSSTVTEWDSFERSARLWSSDSGDTLQQLQLRVARALTRRLVARRNRVGLVSFNFRARGQGGSNVMRLTEKSAVTVPVGKPDAVLAALADFPVAQKRRWTNLTRLIERGAEILDEATLHGEPARPRALLLLSFGKPSAPTGVGWSADQGVGQARLLGKRGIPVWAVALRSMDMAFLEELVRGNGGEVVPLDQLDAQFRVDVPSDLRPKELEIENVTTGAQATSLEVSSDGRFEALVPLEPGPNRLEIRAVFADGHRTTVERQVHFEPGSAEPSP